MSIELRNVSYTYLPNSIYKKEALKDISFKIDDGEYVGIMGDTGSGKSTLVDILAGLVSPSSGEVLIDNKRVGVVFQFPEKQLFASSVKKDVAFGLNNLNLSEKKREIRVKEVIERFGFDYELIKDKSPLEFSYGEKRNLAIAGVSVSRPDVLILDETFAGLDLRSKKFLEGLLRDLNKEGVTIVLISHSGNIIGNNVRRLVYLDDGKKVYDGSVTNFLDLDEDVLKLSKLLKKRGFVSNLTIDYEELLADLLGSFYE